LFPNRKLFLVNERTGDRVLSELFKTPARVSMLRTILGLPVVTVLEIARREGVAKGTVSRYLTLTERGGLIQRSGRKYRVITSPVTIATKKLLNLFQLEDVVTLPGWAEGIGVFGSWGLGTNTAESDLDLWVYAKEVPPAGETGRLQRAIRDAVQSEVHVLVLTPERVHSLQENDPPFYTSLIESMVTLRGQSFVHA